MSMIMRGTLLHESEDFKTSTHFEMLSTEEDNKYKLVYCMSLDEGDLSLATTVTLENKLGYDELVEHGATICMKELNRCVDVFRKVKEDKDLGMTKDGVEIEFRRR